MRELLIHLNKTDPFILEELDSTHLFVDPKSIERLKQRFEIALNENVYQVEGNVEVKATW
jgi:TFIIH basal transcription factor complex TTD-A subunit